MQRITSEVHIVRTEFITIFVLIQWKQWLRQDFYKVMVGTWFSQVRNGLDIYHDIEEKAKKKNPQEAWTS